MKFTKSRNDSQSSYHSYGITLKNKKSRKFLLLGRRPSEKISVNWSMSVLVCLLQRTPVPPSASTPSQPSAMPPSSSKPPSMPKDASVLDKLVGLPSAMNPAEVLPQRRAFFENLCNFLEREGEPLTAAPTVSKQVIDLHRLYIAVRRRGGFEQVRISLFIPCVRHGKFCHEQDEIFCKHYAE